MLFFLFRYCYIPNYIFLMSTYQNSKDVLIRIILFIVALLFCAVFCCCTIDKKVPFFSMVGRYSLWIYLLHRPITLFISDMIKNYLSNSIFVVIISFVLSIIICLVFGNPYVSRPMNYFSQSGVEMILNRSKKRITVAKIFLFIAICCMLCLLFINPQFGLLGVWN